MQIERARKNHDELLWALSDGSRTDMDAWDRADVFDFFRGLEIHQARVKKALNKNNGNTPWRPRSSNSTA